MIMHLYVYLHSHIYIYIFVYIVLYRNNPYLHFCSVISIDLRSKEGGKLSLAVSKWLVKESLSSGFFPKYAAKYRWKRQQMQAVAMTYPMDPSISTREPLLGTDPSSAFPFPKRYCREDDEFPEKPRLVAYVWWFLRSRLNVSETCVC